ncbi:MAG: helix-turn-helix domain-containing protein [Acidobacteriota bacterium]
MATLGEFVKSQRKQRGWTQAQLAERARLSVFTICSVEHGKTNYERETLQKLATAFGLATPEDLFAQLPQPHTRAVTPTRTESDGLNLMFNENIGVGTISGGVITGCNRCLAAMMGYDPRELVGQPSSMIVETQFAGMLAKRFAADLPFTQELTHRRKDGSFVVLHWTCYPVVTGLGRTTWLGITQT